MRATGIVPSKGEKMPRVRLAVSVMAALLVEGAVGLRPAVATPGTGVAVVHGSSASASMGIGDTLINGLSGGQQVSRDIPFYTPQGGVAAGDVNGDGIDEVIVAVANGTFTVFDQFGFRILLPGGSAAFEIGDVIAAGDINHDGFDEIVVGHAGAGNSIQLVPTFGGPVTNFFPSNSSPNFDPGGAIAVCDLNNDGFAEIIVGNGSPSLGNVQIYSNTAATFGTFFPGIHPDFQPGVDRLACADLNGDGWNDLIVLHPAQSDLGLTATRFEFFTDLSRPPVHYFLNDIPPDLERGTDIAAGDLDGDGFAELVIGRAGGGSLAGRVDIMSIAGKTPPAIFPIGPPSYITRMDSLAVGTHPLSAATTTPTASVCTVWNANYIDNTLGDDVANTPGMQHLPASFAAFAISVGGQQVASGSLDVNGCVDVSAAAFTSQGQLQHPGATWTLATTSIMTDQLPGGAFPAGPLVVNVQERLNATAPPGSIVETAAPTQPITVSTQFSITAPGTITVTPTTQNSVTAVSAFVSTILARSSQPGGDVGLKPGTINVFSGQACPGSETSGCGASDDRLGTSCAVGGGCNQLFISQGFNQNGTTCPANIGIGGSHWKFVIAHEFGHIIQANFGVSIAAKYTPTPGGRPAVCRCDHVLVSNQEHCMQSIQRASDSQLEGFAQFYAANTWNSPQRTACTFEYYKEFLVSQQPNLPAGDFNFVQVPPENANPDDLTAMCARGAALPPGTAGDPNSFFSILPPMAIDCFGNPAAVDPRAFVNYRSQAGCWTTPSAADFTTEFDWLKFYMNLNRSPAPATIGMTALLQIYGSICNVTTPCGPTNGPNGTELPPEATPAWTDLQAAATTQLTSDQAKAFQNAGKTFGVDNNL
jgi:hypothetical protein